jgi:hypothetical protein
MRVCVCVFVYYHAKLTHVNDQNVIVIVIHVTYTKVTSLKATLIDILYTVGDIRTNFRLGNLLQRFKEYCSHETLEV